jgi:TolB-like protein
VAAVALVGWWSLREDPAQGSPIVSSIAVLPLENLTGDPEQEYFVDGMTDALMTDLSKIGALKVISHNSAMRYKGSDKPLAEIAEELKVEALIQGSISREGQRITITAQLTEAATDRSLWADRYERDLTSILALQGEVAQAIARQIQVTMTSGEETLLTGRRPVEPDAYEAYLRGQLHFGKLTMPSCSCCASTWPSSEGIGRRPTRSWCTCPPTTSGSSTSSFARSGSAGCGWGEVEGSFAIASACAVNYDVNI